MDGQRLVVFLPNADIIASPEWMPAEGASPPLTTSDAVAHLKHWMARDPRYREDEIHEIKLRPIRHHEEEHRCYYLFQLGRPGECAGKVMYTAELLNSEVVPAIVEPTSITQVDLAQQTSAVAGPTASYRL